MDPTTPPAQSSANRECPGAPVRPARPANHHQLSAQELDAIASRLVYLDAPGDGPDGAGGPGVVAGLAFSGLALQ